MMWVVSFFILLSSLIDKYGLLLIWNKREILLLYKLLIIMIKIE